jgi:hypothetical protein
MKVKMEALVFDPTVARRNDIPTGAVPEYREFLRRVWSWQEEGGGACVDGPPWMYTIMIQDPVEVSLVSSLLGTLHQLDQLDDRFEIIVMEDGSEFSFANLAALHVFLRSCAALGACNETARRVCEYIMWTLGFRWV